MATKQFSIKVPPSTTEQTINVLVNIPDPIISVPQPIVTQSPPSYTQADATETHTITGTTAPPPVVVVPPPVVVAPPPIVTPTPIVRANLIFDFTCEQEDALTKSGVKLLNYYNSFGKAADYSITRSANIARTGKYSTRYELRNTDADVFGSKRTEAARASNDEPTLAERWYGMSYYLPNEYVPDTAPELLTQWQSLKGVSPPLAIWTKAGKWAIDQKFNLATDLNTLKTVNTVIGDCETARWTDFVVHVKWSIGSDGLVEVWKDGVKVFTKSGPNTYFGISTGNYMKTGIYKWPWAHTESYSSNTTKRVIYIDDVRIGNEKATYNDVRPGN